MVHVSQSSGDDLTRVSGTGPECSSQTVTGYMSLGCHDDLPPLTAPPLVEYSSVSVSGVAVDTEAREKDVILFCRGLETHCLSASLSVGLARLNSCGCVGEHQSSTEQ